MSILDLEAGKKVRVRARCTGQSGFPERDNGDVQLAVQFRISDDDPEYAGEHITYYQRLVDETNFEYAWKSLRACGVTSNDLEDLRGIDANEVELVVEAREYEGETYVDVKYVNPLGGPGLTIKKPAGASKLKALSAQARGAALKVKAPAAPAAAPAAAPRAAPAARPTPRNDAPYPGGQGDDIPF
jgi:hypothetical protein